MNLRIKQLKIIHSFITCSIFKRLLTFALTHTDYFDIKKLYKNSFM